MSFSLSISSRRFASILFSLLLLGSCLLWGQNQDSITISANVLSSRVAIGEFGTMIVEISGAEGRLPEQVSAQGLEISHSGKQSSIEIINGVQTIKFTHFYRFRGNEPGTYTIPPIQITLPRGEQTTAAIQVTVFERDGSETLDATRPYFAKLELNRTEFYVNELVPFTVTTYVRGRNTISDVVQPRFDHESFVIRSFRDVRTDGDELGSTYYSSAILPSSLFALKAGDHRLGPANLGVRVLDSSSGFGFSSFFSRTVIREMATNTVKVKVKPLPAGAPRGFSGAVGSFQLAVEPSTTQVSVGDPISMKFLISGTGNRQTISEPVFQTLQKGLWKSYEASKQIEDERDNDGFTAGTVIFSQVIIPEAKVETIPSFEFSYFDPMREEYVTRVTDPIPIEVSADSSSRPIQPVSFPRDSNKFSSNPSASRPEAKYDDVLYIRTSPPRWIAVSNLGSHSWLYYAMHGFFSICFLTLLAFAVVKFVQGQRLKKDTSGIPANFQEALAQIPDPGTPRRDYYRAVSTALSRWREEHNDAPDAVFEVINRVSKKCEEFLYGGLEESDSPITAEETTEFQSILRKLPRK